MTGSCDDFGGPDPRNRRGMGGVGMGGDGVRTAGLVLRRLGPGDEADAAALMVATMGGRHQVRLDGGHDVLALPGLGAFVGRGLAGVVTWDPAPDRVELAALAVRAERRGAGIGGVLVEATVDAAAASGAGTVWLVTTNDNLDALRLYQRHGFRLAGLRAGAVDRSRATLKPGIPALGAYGIPIRDELVLERAL